MHGGAAAIAYFSRRLNLRATSPARKRTPDATIVSAIVNSAYVNFAPAPRRFAARKSLPRWRLVFVNAATQTRCLYPGIFFPLFSSRSAVHTLPPRPVNNSRRRIDYHRPVGGGGGGCVSSLRKSSRRRFLSPRSGAVTRATFAAALPSPSRSDTHSCPKTRDGDSRVYTFFAIPRGIVVRERTYDTCNFFQGRGIGGDMFIDINRYKSDVRFSKCNKIYLPRLTIE